MFQCLCVCVCGRVHDKFTTKCFDGFEHQIESSLYFKQIQFKNSQILFL